MELLRDPTKLAAAMESIAVPTEFFSYIDGKPVKGDLASFAVENPANGKTFAHSPSCSQKQLDDATKAARKALTPWNSLGQDKRKALMVQVAKKLSSPAVFLKLGKVLCLEQGKKMQDAVGEVLGCVSWIHGSNKFSIPAPELLEENEKMRVEQHMQPVGVVGAITPWNYPLLLAMWKIAPAMIAGCTMVLKPSPYTPLATCLMAEVINSVLPPGVFNVVAGGNDLGKWMTAHTGFDKISFTGSIATGKQIQKSAAGTLKRLTLELGGNDAAIIMPGTDSSKIASKLFDGAFGNSGQVCAAIKRVYVHEDDHDALVAALVAQANKTSFGDGMLPTTTHGPLNNQMQLDIVRKYVEDSRSRGAHIECGGMQIGNKNGFTYAPTIITNVDETFDIVREEQFGPALPIIKYKTLDDALRQANDSDVGLGGSVWGHDTKAASEVARGIMSGTAWVNQHKVMTPNTPFGGFKQSGIGRENGLGGLMNFLEPQTFNVAKVSWAKL